MWPSARRRWNISTPPSSGITRSERTSRTRPGLAREHLQPFLAVRRHEDLVAQLLQRARRRPAQHLLVLHHQDGLLAPQLPCRHRAFPGTGTAAVAREVEPHRRPPARLAVDPDEPAVLLHQAEHHRQAETRAAPGALVVKNGSKTRSRVAASIPAPVSDDREARVAPRPVEAPEGLRILVRGTRPR